MPPPLTTSVSPETISWRLPDPSRELDQVRLWSDFDLGDTGFVRVNGGWELRRPVRALPPVDRLEYLFEVTRGGNTGSIIDPGNPLRVGGAFGDHSWVSISYCPPAWLEVEPVAGDRQSFTVSNTPVGEVEVQLWSPAGSDPTAELPLLLSHDGPEMNALGELTRYVGAMISLRQAQGTGGLPPMRVGLLTPGPRNERYAANPAYAEALCKHVVPAVLDRAPASGRPVLIGQSLGAVAALHAEWTHPGTFGGLLLQSGSFFTPELDGQEAGFSHWQPVTEFVQQVLTASAAPRTLPIAVGCGTAEENAATNRQMAAKLAALGCEVTGSEVRDGHTFTGWRDLLDPLLTDLLHRVNPGGN